MVLRSGGAPPKTPTFAPEKIPKEFSRSSGRISAMMCHQQRERADPLTNRDVGKHRIDKVRCEVRREYYQGAPETTPRHHQREDE